MLINFAVAVGGMSLLCLPGVAVSSVSRLAGVDIFAVLKIVPFILASLLPFILPLSYLLSVVATYGRLAADNEWIAIKMSGMHPMRMLLPSLPLALLLGGGSMWFMAEGLPNLRRLQDSVMFHAVRDAITNLSPGRTELHLPGFDLVAKFRDKNDFLDALIQFPTKEGEEPRTIAARRVSFAFHGSDVSVELTDSRSVDGPHDATIASLTVQFNLDDLRQKAERNFTTLRYRPTSLIRQDLQEAGLEPRVVERLLFEIHERNAIASLYLMFMMLGIPIGLLLRSSTQLGALAVAVGIALVYYILAMRLGQELASSHQLPPLVCAWAVNVMGLVVGSFLMLKVCRQ
ncbi:MAG TPA: LptF/LptG family permease [Planctomycetota bacterium]|nr:LptF/LptG family permease [Planctomycetota bacterium]